MFLCSQERIPSSKAGFQPAKSSASSTLETSEGAIFLWSCFRPSLRSTRQLPLEVGQFVV